MLVNAIPVKYTNGRSRLLDRATVRFIHPPLRSPKTLIGQNLWSAQKSRGWLRVWRFLARNDRHYEIYRLRRTLFFRIFFVGRSSEGRQNTVGQLSDGRSRTTPLISNFKFQLAKAGARRSVRAVGPSLGQLKFEIWLKILIALGSQN